MTSSITARVMRRSLLAYKNLTVLSTNSNSTFESSINLKEVLANKIPAHNKKVVEFRKAFGGTVIQKRLYSDEKPESLKTVLERIKNVLSQYDEKEPEKLPDQDEFFKDLAHLVTQAEATISEVNDLKDKYRRALAETENVRRRGQKQVEDAKIYAVQNFCKDLVGVSDTLDLAIGAFKPEVIEKVPEVKTLHDGVVMMKSVLMKTFEKHGLAAVSPDGEKFDPNLHEAVFQIPKEQASAKPGHIGHVMKIGYSLHGRPVRAAQVGVVQE